MNKKQARYEARLPELHALQSRIEKALGEGWQYSREGVRTSFEIDAVTIQFEQGWRGRWVLQALEGKEIEGIQPYKDGDLEIVVKLPKKPGPLARRIAALEAQVAELTKGKAPEVKPPPAPPIDAPPVRGNYRYMGEYQRCVDKAEAALKANLASGPLTELHKELHEPKTVRELEQVIWTFSRLAASEFPHARSTDTWRVARAVVAFYRPHLVSDV
jgi:hypothetical protein